MGARDATFAAYPGQDIRRIDLMIGEKARWGLGIGTEAIRLLTEFAFGTLGADLVFACDIADYNERSMKAFNRVGYRMAASLERRPGGKTKRAYDLMMDRDDYHRHSR